MIRLPLSEQDLATTRIAYSPLWESVLSFHAMARPDRHVLPVPWVGELRRAASGLDLRPMQSALADHRVLFDFLFPLPSGPDPTFADQLDQLRATDPEEVARQVEWHFASMDEATPPALRPFVDRPRRSMERLATSLASYWDQALRPHWPRVRGMLEADLLHRSRVLAAEGTVAMIRGLHPEVRWRDGGLDVHRTTDWEVQADRPGLVLVPSAFAWPSTAAGTIDGVKIVEYPARGLGALWERHPLDRRDAVDALLGPTRASLVLALRDPTATTDLAAALDVAGSSVSYHLGQLRRAGMVEWHREGRRVLYRLSDLGAGLLRLWGLDEPPGALAGDEEDRPA